MTLGASAYNFLFTSCYSGYTRKSSTASDQRQQEHPHNFSNVRHPALKDCDQFLDPLRRLDSVQNLSSKETQGQLKALEDDLASVTTDAGLLLAYRARERLEVP
jgi:hypothetical protein